LVIEECNCNFSIPGVEKLPGHYHAYDFIQTWTEVNEDGSKKVHYETEVTIHFHVDWKEYAKEILKEAYKEKNWYTQKEIRA
jgi:hypothetical protein